MLKRHRTVRVSIFVYLLLAVAARAIAADVTGIKNFDQVDSRVYRGAQPTREGINYLATLGVKVVIDLRQSGDRSRAEERMVKDLGMTYINVPMSGLAPPTQPELRTILAILEDPSSSPVFVHCLRGADRTGAVIAAYQIEYHHWDNSRALTDALNHKMGSIQIPRKNFIRNFRPRTTTAFAGGGPVPATPR